MIDYRRIDDHRGQRVTFELKQNRWINGEVVSYEDGWINLREVAVKVGKYGNQYTCEWLKLDPSNIRFFHPWPKEGDLFPL